MNIQSPRGPLQPTIPGVLRSLMVSAVLLLGGRLVQAQTNSSITWSRIAGGGGTCTNGPYSLSGTLGQFEAGGPLTGGGFSLTGGFWAGVVAIQTPGAPVLSITRSGGNVILSWPAPAAGYILQQSPAVPYGVWTEVNLTPVDNGGLRSVTLPPNQGSMFFRLKKCPC